MTPDPPSSAAAIERVDAAASPMSAADYTAQLARAGVRSLEDIDRSRPENRALLLRWCLQRYDAELCALTDRAETLLARVRGFDSATSVDEVVGRLAIDTQAFKQLCSDAVLAAEAAARLERFIAGLMKPRTGIALVDHPLSAKIASGLAAIAGGGATFLACSTFFHWIEHLFHIESGWYTAVAVTTEALATLYVAARAPSATVGRLKGWAGALSGRQVHAEQQALREALVDPADDVLKNASELSRKLVELARRLWQNVYRLRQLLRDAAHNGMRLPEHAPDGGEVAKAVRIVAGAAALRRSVAIKFSVAHFMQEEPAHLDEFFKLIAHQLPGWIVGPPQPGDRQVSPLLRRFGKAPAALLRQFKGFSAGLLEGAGDFGEKAKHMGEQIERAVLDMTVLMAFDAIRFLAETSERLAGHRITVHAAAPPLEKHSDDVFSAFTKVFLSRSLWGTGEYGRVLGRSLATLAAAAVKTIPYIDAMKELMTGQAEHTPETAARSLRRTGLREMIDTSAQLMMRAVKSSALAIAQRVESRLFHTDYAGFIIESALMVTVQEQEARMDALLAEWPRLGEHALSEATMPMEVLWNLHMLPSLSDEERGTLIALIRYWEAHRTWQAARAKLANFRHAKELEAISPALIPNIRAGKNIESNLNRRRKVWLPTGAAGRMTILHGLPDGSLLILDARDRPAHFRLYRSIPELMQIVAAPERSAAETVAMLGLLQHADVARIRLAEHLLGPLDDEQEQALLSGRRRQRVFSAAQLAELRAARLID